MEQNNTQFDKIIIPDLLLADMYKQSLVLLNDIQISPERAAMQAAVEATAIPEPIIANAAIVKKSIQELTWLGNFNKRILIVVNEPDAVYLNDADMQLLTKMLEAVKISLADVAIVNFAHFDISNFDALNQSLPGNFYILFDVEATAINVPLRIQPYQVLPWNGKQFLYSPSLTAINTPGPDQVNMKKSIWMGLKKIFDVFQ